VTEKGQNTGGALAVTKGLVGQVEGLVGKFPSTLHGKNALLNPTLRVLRKAKGSIMSEASRPSPTAMTQPLPLSFLFLPLSLLPPPHFNWVPGVLTPGEFWN